MNKMMKNAIALFIVLGVFLPCFKLQAMEMLPEVKAAYFYPTDNRFREIYGGGGLYSIEKSVQAWKQFYPWMSLGFFRKDGRSLEKRFDTHIIMVPIGLGVKYLFTYKKMNPYLGLGMLVTYTNMHDHSPYVVRKFGHWGVGGIVKAGSYMYVTKDFFIDVFCDYSYLKINYHHPSRKVRNLRADLSGLSIGAGLGYRF